MVRQPQHVSAPRKAVEALAHAAGFKDSEAGNVGLTVGQAMANVIQHGYGGPTDGPICVKIGTISVPRSGLQITVDDDCKDVDLSQIESRSMDELRSGGLGVHLIRRIMDVVEYGQRDDGLGLRMCKYRYESELNHG